MHFTKNKRSRRDNGRRDRICASRAEFNGIIESLEKRICLSATFTPAPGSPIAVGHNPHVAAVGDYNGDGIPDLAVTNADDNTVSILLGKGDGSFTPAPGSPIAVGPGPVAVVAGDFNGDGKLDLAIADFSNNGVNILLGNGNGTFTAGQNFAVGSKPSGISAGDFTGDGKLDLAIANFGDNTVTIVQGTGAGTFQAVISGSPITVGNEPFYVSVGDYNGDGVSDLAVANFGGNTISVLLGNGDGTFTAAPGSPIAVGSGSYTSTTGDFNGDGKLDLAVANFNDKTVSVLLGNGDGTFTAAPGSPLSVGTNPFSVVSADFNGDGKSDLATANFGTNNVSVLLGNGNGTFTAAPDSPIASGTSPVSLSVGDFNKDARPDLVVSDATVNTLSVLLNSSAAPLPTGTLGASVSASLPSAVIAGGKVKASALVTVSASTGAALNGPVTITLYASPAQSLSGATQLLPPITKKLKLKAGARKTLRIKLSSFPAALNGSYYIIATVKGPDGTTTGAAGSSLTISAPFVSILTTNQGGSPATIAPGKKASLTLTLQNNGNKLAAGTAATTISLSTGSTGAGGQALTPIPLHVKLKPAQRKAYRIKFVVPAGTAAGSYYLSASLAVSALGDPTAAHGIAVSAGPVTVS